MSHVDLWRNISAFIIFIIIIIIIIILYYRDAVAKVCQLMTLGSGVRTLHCSKQKQHRCVGQAKGI